MKKTEGENLRKSSKGFFHHASPPISFLIFLLIFWLILPSLPTGEMKVKEGGNVPLWWSDTRKRAEAGGYALINFQDLQALIKSGKDYVLVDVRPDYEYRAGHMPGAQNLEFHLGHRSGLEPERAQALRTLLGKDRNRVVVTYCRNFR